MINVFHAHIIDSLHFIVVVATLLQMHTVIASMTQSPVAGMGASGAASGARFLAAPESFSTT